MRRLLPLLAGTVVFATDDVADEATWEVEIEPDLWLCAFNVSLGKTWPQTYGVCNQDAGFHLATVGPMTDRGLPSDANINRSMSAAAARGHDYVTTGHPARSCFWDQAGSGVSYESCNGLGYISTRSRSATGGYGNWLALTDGNVSERRSRPSANRTGAHPLASVCMAAPNATDYVVYDHRWRRRSEVMP